MISCPKCGKENQDHYKFCLGCGNELPRDGGRAVRPTPNAVPLNNPEGVRRPAPATPMPNAVFAAAPASPVGAAVPFAPVQPPPPIAAPVVAPAPVAPPVVQPAPMPVAAPVAAAPVAAAPVAAPVAAPAGFPSSCPQCSSPNPRNNRFCITCGFDMTTAAAPVAAPPPPPPPPPVVQEPPPPQIVAPTVPVQVRAIERGKLILIRPDGSEGGSFPLMEGKTLIGREAGGLFAQDMYLSPRHATFTILGAQVTIEDNDSLNGLYLRVERQVPVEIHDGDIFRIGQEILLYRAFGTPALESDGTEQIGAQVEGLVGKVSLVIGRESFGNAFPIPITGLYLGRERGDILFPEDGYVSGLHCQLLVTGGVLTLTDVGSSNGTYLRIHGPRNLQNGDFLLMGQQLFRLVLT